MKKYAVWLLIFGTFLLEGTILKWVIPSSWQSTLYVVPHFVLVLILYLSIFVNRYYGLVAGLILGFLQDIMYYGHALGVYSFAMGLSGYAVGLAVRRNPQPLFVCMNMIILGNLLYDLLIYGIYRYFLRVVSAGFEWTLTHQMLPSLFINMLFALAIYVPARKLLEGLEWQLEKDDD